MCDLYTFAGYHGARWKIFWLGSHFGRIKHWPQGFEFCRCTPVLDWIVLVVEYVEIEIKLSSLVRHYPDVSNPYSNPNVICGTPKVSHCLPWWIAVTSKSKGSNVGFDVAWDRR